MRPARAAGQIWDQARDPSAAVSVERAQANVPRGAAGGGLAEQAVEQSEFQHSRRDPYRRMMSWLLPRIGRSGLHDLD
jgi:hypothetical protein